MLDGRGGVVRTRDVAELIVKFAATPPTVMDDVSDRLAPVNVMLVLPAMGPEPTLSDEILGGATYVKPDDSVRWPSDVTTVTFTAPAELAGVRITT